MTRIIWSLVGLNSLALLVFIVYFFVVTSGKHVDYMEGGWTIILCSLALIVILLAAIPLRYGHSKFSVVFAAFFAVLPLFIAGWFFFSRKISSWKRKETYARVFYKDPAQRAIASAIEHGDTVLLKQLINGKDLNVKGTRVWDAEGFNYLQFAIHIRSNPIDFPFNDEASRAAIRILLRNGSPVTPALESATKYLPVEMVEELLEAGGDPNVVAEVGLHSLLFDNIGSNKKQNDIALLLVRYGADVNRKNDNDFTPLMYAADMAETDTQWYDGWRVARYILERGGADFNYRSRDGKTFASLVADKQQKAVEKGIVLSPDFKAVIHFLAGNSTEKVTN